MRANATQVVYALIPLGLLATNLYADEIRNGRTGKLSKNKYKHFHQCCGDPDPHWLWSARSESALANADPDPGGWNDQKIEKYKKNCMFWSAGFSFLGAEAFPCSLDVFH